MQGIKGIALFAYTQKYKAHTHTNNTNEYKHFNACGFGKRENKSQYT